MTGFAAGFAAGFFAAGVAAAFAGVFFAAGLRAAAVFAGEAAFVAGLDFAAGAAAFLAAAGFGLAGALAFVRGAGLVVFFAILDLSVVAADAGRLRAVRRESGRIRRSIAAADAATHHRPARPENVLVTRRSRVIA